MDRPKCVITRSLPCRTGFACTTHRFSCRSCDIQLAKYDARERLTQYSWPGNVRELANVVERMVVLRTGSTLSVDDLTEEVRDAACGHSLEECSPGDSQAPESILPTDAALSYHDAVRESKRSILQLALERYVLGQGGVVQATPANGH